MFWRRCRVEVAHRPHKSEVAGSDPAPVINLPLWFKTAVFFAILTATASVGLILYMIYNIWVRGSYSVVEPNKAVLIVETICFSVFFMALVMLLVYWWEKDYWTK